MRARTSVATFAYVRWGGNQNGATLLTAMDEHLGYISDTRRLELFQQALSRIITQGDLVADVGSGFGILGLLCLRSGAAHVWGMDNTDAIEIARETMERAGFADSYTCIRERSFTVTLPQLVDVIVCDHVGYFGIDYGIIEALGDGRRRMLKPGGRIVPSRLRLMLAGAATPIGREKAEAWMASGIPAEYHWLREYGVNSKHARMFSRDEIVTEPVLLGAIDLTTGTPDLLAFKASLTALRDGLLDGLAGWFVCELAKGVWMTNSPLSDQPIDRPQVFLAFDAPIAVESGDVVEVSVSIRHDTGLISWSARDPRTGRKQKQSTWNSRILSRDDLARNPAKALSLTREAKARHIVCGYVDGARSVEDIEHIVLREHPDLFPSPGEISRFVRRELGRSAR